MTAVKSDSPFQPGHNQPTDSPLVSADFERSMIHEIGEYHAEDARMILNSRYKGNISDIIHEIRNE